MSGICDTCHRDQCNLRMDGLKMCDLHERGESNYEWLFGTPERAARTLSRFCTDCFCGDCATCGVPEWACYRRDYDALLGWLRGESDGK